MTNNYDMQVDFGATLDGVTPDDTAYAKAFSAVQNSKTGAGIKVPGIMYLANPRPVLDLQAGQCFRLLGNGPNLSGIKSAYGDTINFPSGDLLAGNVGASGMSFKSLSAGTADAFTLISNNIPNPGPIKGFYDCVFQGSSGSQNYWANAITMNGCTFPSMDNVYVGGYDNAGVYKGNGFNIKNSQSAHAVDYLLSKIRMWNVNIGVSGAGPIEGLNLQLFSMICNVGVQWMNTSSVGLPQLYVIGGHINSKQCGIQTDNVVQAQIKNILFYQGQEGGTEQWCAIDMANSNAEGVVDAPQISGNTICGTTANNSNGIAVANSCAGLISQNTIINTTTPIWIKPGCQNMRVLDNPVSNYLNVDIFDQGSGTVIRRI